MGHSDAGIILRARDESDFYLLHFPNCGQASRAQHFWAAFSRMDHKGYRKVLKLDLVRRVPSTSGLWLRCEITLKGRKIPARIDGRGNFEAEGRTYAGPGH